jgi:hypothetical protein
LIGLPALFAEGPSAGAPSAGAPITERVSLLARPAQPQDRLPRLVRTWPFALHHYGDGHGARLAYQQGGERLYVIPARHDQLCLVRLSTGEIPAAGTCNPRSMVRGGAIYAAFPSPSGESRVVGVVSDGWQSVTFGNNRAPVRANVFAIGGRSTDTHLTLVAPGGATRSVAITGPVR